LKQLLSNTIGNVKNKFDIIMADNSNDYSRLDLQKQINYINSALDLIDNFRHSYRYINEIIKNAIDQQNEEANQKLQKFDQVINKLQGIATEQVYANANTNYQTRYKNLEN